MRPNGTDTRMSSVDDDEPQAPIQSLPPAHRSQFLPLGDLYTC
jgi:hypothetical protein